MSFGRLKFFRACGGQNPHEFGKYSGKIRKFREKSKISKIEKFEKIIKKRDRKLAGRTIEAKGLYFVGPEYNNLDYKVNKVFVNELD